MALVNQTKREINAKIVFFGPGLAGKATSLKHVFNKLKPEFRGAMKVMNVQDARMLFFDFTPPGDGNVDGYRVRFHLYTISGRDVDPAAWKMVLKGVDGVVFVADGSSQRVEENRTGLGDLAGFLKGYGQSLATVPAVLQANKSDLPDAMSAAELERALSLSGVPVFGASSQRGEGVLQALMALVKSILAGMRAKGAEGIASGETLQRAVETPAAHAAAPAEAPPKAAPEAPATPVREAPSAPRASGFQLAEDPLTLELAGAPRAAGGDVITVPLTIRSGTRTKSVFLTLSLSVEEG